MPITRKKIKSLSSIKNKENLSFFLNMAKDIQEKQGFLKNEDIKSLANRYGIADSVAISILSFYEMIKFEKSDVKYVCKAPGCNTYNGKDCNFINCLGLCDHNSPGIFNGEQVSFQSDKISKIGKTKILNSDNKNLYLLNIKDVEYYLDKLNKLLEVNPNNLIDNIISSNLTGKGGAGFPTGKKLQLTRQSKGEKIVICNADESEPFVFKDRGIIDNNPFAVVSGMILAAHMVNAKDIYIYIRGEYIKQKEILKETVDIFQNKFKGFNFTIVSGAGAYICGEETALLESIEGKRGHPRIKPPFPGESGLFNKPTIIQNVETMGWIFEILAERPSIADRRIFSIAGEVNSKGIFETDGSNSINEIVAKFAGGFANKENDYFAIIGGASGFFVNSKQFEKPLKKLLENKSGAGSIYIFSKYDKLKEIMLYILDFFAEQSCGQCNPCFLGYSKLKNLISNNRFEEAVNLSSSISKSTLCGLGKAGFQPVSSFIKIVEGEYFD
ncbi:hypothetical protein LF845_07250 [Deferribacterales bacterium Es71-Z0220]|uniref:NADH-ubiquinone oxidoreductase-F iron-sulfur binding region domain-containing protein n=1 Tax=Deferrivibrio essentukiensis TaxID=2880922 RepID=UPI001F60391E|nr:NADH-ubiquinone oxidoreductase-F iron-sulfur binding region domain-containing protein [Deferrivibrio essentukiensis]MCB4204755.1 hypothetical protein [Deferrivibrio essentukiensis]